MPLTLEDVVKQHLNYEYKGKPPKRNPKGKKRKQVYVPKPCTEKDGIPFWSVGHNASHDFYLGYADGVVYSGSCGEDWIPCDCYQKMAQVTEKEAGEIEMDCRDKHCIIEFQYSKVEGDRVPYLGHW